MPKREVKKQTNGKSNGKGNGGTPTAKGEPGDQKIKVRICRGEKALTAEIFKEMIGWEEVDDFDESCCPELKRLMGKNVRLHKNMKNRYITLSWLLELIQEHLNKRMRFNGEAVIFGENGNLLDGQHRGLSLIVAEHERSEGPNKRRWQTVWPDPITFETLVVYGIPEDDDTFKTLNRGKPGGLAEVLYRSEHLEKFPPKKRRTIARALDTSLKLLWNRTGAGGEDAWAPRRTHGEAFDFIYRHPWILESVELLYEMDVATKSGISQQISIGCATGLAYLMAASGSNWDDYHNATPPTEDVLNFDNRDLALDFWNKFGSKEGEFPIVHEALAALVNPITGASGSMLEKIAVLIKSWDLFVSGYPFNLEELELRWLEERTDDGTLVRRRLDEFPTLGGIDIGEPTNGGSEMDDEAIEEYERNKAEIAARKTEEVSGKVVEGTLKGEPGSFKDELAELKEEYPGKLLIFNYGKVSRIWDDDAHTAASVLKEPVEIYTGLPCIKLNTSVLEQVVEKLARAKVKSLIIDVNKPTKK